MNRNRTSMSNNNRDKKMRNTAELTEVTLNTFLVENKVFAKQILRVFKGRDTFFVTKHQFFTG
jgi:hypothetical protein